MMNEEQLLRLKRDIEQAKNKVAELNGQHKLLIQQLRDTWKCDSIEEAQKKLTELEKEASRIEDTINKMTEILVQNYFTIKGNGNR